MYTCMCVYIHIYIYIYIYYLYKPRGVGHEDHRVPRGFQEYCLEGTAETSLDSKNR